MTLLFQSKLRPQLATEVHIWLLDPNDLTNETFSATGVHPDYWAWLSKEEQQRQLRFHFEKDQRLFASAHLFVRYLLSHYVPIAPEEWCFNASDLGKPEITNKEGQGIRFNLSHTDGMIACAVTESLNVGVDVERLGRVKKPSELAERIFTQREQNLMLDMTKKEEDQYFFSLWVLKEALVKATGAGISFGVEKLDFSLSVDALPSLSFQPAHLGNSDAWQFYLASASKNIKLGLALEKGDEPQRRVVIKKGIKNWALPLLI